MGDLELTSGATLGAILALVVVCVASKRFIILPSGFQVGCDDARNVVEVIENIWNCQKEILKGLCKK